MKRISKKGFTLIELLIVVVVLAVLAVIAIPTFSGDISNSKTAVAKEDAAALARDAEGLADTNADAGGNIPNANNYVVAAGDEVSITLVSDASDWTVTSSNGGSACLTIPDATNAAFTVAGGACTA